MTLKASPLAMVPFVSVDNMMRLVRHIGVETALAELSDAIEQDFIRWPLFDKTPRLGSHSDVGVIELMPTSDGERYAFKYVNGHPKNMKEGLQTVTAFGVLAEVDTGYPILLSEMTILTALRTGAMSAVATKHLARPDSATLAMIGNGAQSEFQCLAIKAVCGIDKIKLYDLDPAATEKCARNLAGYGFEIDTCPTPEAAIEGADVITVATADKNMQTILTDNMVGAGVHINAIGGDCPGKTELHRDIVARSNVFVEFPPQTRIEGEIQQMPDNHPVTELWQVIGGDETGRTSSSEVTLFDGVGFAIEDFSALNYVHRKIQDTPFYADLDLIADPDDPRDLFGMIQRAG